MDTRRYLLAAVAALVCPACWAGNEQSLTDAERAAIADTVQRLSSAIVQAFDAQDCEAELPVADDMVTVANGRVFELPNTKAERIAACEKMNEQRLSAHDEIQEQKVHVLGSDAAYVVSRSIYTIRWRDGRTTIRPNVGTGIWSREAEGWRLVHFHESWPEADERSISPQPPQGGGQ